MQELLAKIAQEHYPESVAHQHVFLINNLHFVCQSFK